MQNCAESIHVCIKHFNFNERVYIVPIYTYLFCRRRYLISFKLHLFQFWDRTTKLEYIMYLISSMNCQNNSRKHEKSRNVVDTVIPLYLVGPGLYSLSGKKSYGKMDVIMIALQHCCRGACQISEQLKNSKSESRDVEAPRDLAIRRLSV